MATRYKAWIYCSWLAAIAGSNPAVGIDGCLCENCVLSGRGVCDGPITGPEEAYGVCVIECDRVQ